MTKSGKRWMPSFNLSSWALRNQALVLYSIILLGLIGIWSFRGLGQAEDPPFTFKVMVVHTVWPGATAGEVAEKITETIEKKLQEIPDLDFLRSYSRPGESQVFFVVKDSIAPGRVPDVWYQVRKVFGSMPRSAEEVEALMMSLKSVLYENDTRVDLVACQVSFTRPRYST